jgi:catechol 2,3-dioxygenase-like lactoylglutathione lyase family enzyme
MSQLALLFVCDGGRTPANGTPVGGAATESGYRCAPDAAGDPLLQRAPGADGVEGTIVEIGMAQLGRLLAAVEAPCTLDVIELRGGEHAFGLLSDPEPPDPRAAWDHTSLAVRDLDEAIGFYRELLGFEVAFEERVMAAQIAGVTGLPGLECDIAQLRSPASRHVLELIAFRHAAAARESGKPIMPGMGHVAFTVEDLERTLDAVTRLGGHMLGEVTRFEEGLSAYCREPAGSFLELSERLG